MRVRTTQRHLPRVSGDHRNGRFDGRSENILDDHWPVTPRQICFLEECCDTPDRFEIVMARYGLTSRRLAEWLSNRLFCAQVMRCRGRLVRHRKAIVVGLEAPGWNRRAAVTIVRLARDLRSRPEANQDPDRHRLSQLYCSVAERRDFRECRRLIRALESE